MKKADIGHVQWVLEKFRGNYEATSNPIYVWSAWRLAKRAALPSPKWVENAFDIWAGNLIALCKLPPKQDVAQVAGQAIGFDGGKNGKNFFRKMRQADNQERAMWLYFEAFKDAKSLAEAKRTVAKEMGVSDDTVERLLEEAWKTSVTDVSPLNSVEDLLSPNIAVQRGKGNHQS